MSLHAVIQWFHFVNNRWNGKKNAIWSLIKKNNLFLERISLPEICQNGKSWPGRIICLQCSGLMDGRKGTKVPATFIKSRQSPEALWQRWQMTNLALSCGGISRTQIFYLFIFFKTTRTIWIWTTCTPLAAYYDTFPKSFQTLCLGLDLHNQLLISL